MSRIFFISCNTATDPYAVYPLGMAVVSGALIAAGHQVEQYDCLVHGRDKAPLKAAVSAFNPDFIAISLRNIDNVDSFCGEEGWYLKNAKDLVSDLRTMSSAPILLGGPALTIMPETIADYVGVDHAVIGEGEQSVPALIAALAAGEQPGKIIPRRPPLGGHEFASPVYVDDMVAFYQRESDVINIQTKRGCPYQCSYCSYPHLEGQQFRVREPRQVVAELQQLKEQHGVDSVFFTDSVFNDPKGHYLELVEEMLRSDLQVRWSAFFRPQHLDRENLALMKRAGLYALELGTDAGSDKTLKGINKRLTFDEIFAVNEACLAERLPAAHYVIFGGPGEDNDSLEEGLRNMEQLGASVVFAFSGIRIFPDSPLHPQAIAEGIISEDTSLLKPVYYFSQEIDRKHMEARIIESWAGRKNRVFPPSEGLKRIAVMRDFGYRGLMWDYLVRFPKEKQTAAK